MANIGSALKEEITRLAKKVVKQNVQALQKSSTSHRRQIAALKRTIAGLNRELGPLRRGLRSQSTAKASEGEAASKTRFQAKGLKSFRGRLGLSATDFGKLVGVTGQTIYNWESEKATPRREQINALAQIRGMGKRDALKRLENSALVK